MTAPVPKNLKFACDLWQFRELPVKYQNERPINNDSTFPAECKSNSTKSFNNFNHKCRFLSSRLSEHARLQNVSLRPRYFTVHWIEWSTALGKAPLCYWSKLILEQTRALTLCGWRQLLNPQRALLKYVHLSLRTSSHCYDDRWPKKPEFLPANSWVPL